MLYSILGLLHLILLLIAALEILGSGKPLLHMVLRLLLMVLLPIVELIIHILDRARNADRPRLSRGARRCAGAARSVGGRPRPKARPRQRVAHHPCGRGASRK